jgi:transposase
MRAYSLDLRQRILAALDSGMSRYSVARIFRVSRVTIKRYLSRRQDTGGYAPRRGPGRTARIGRAQYGDLRAQLESSPDGTLEEHCRLWEQTYQVRVSVSTMHRAIARCGWTRKKKTVSACEQDPFARATWQTATTALPNQDFVFVDESSTNIAMARRYARSPRGEPAVAKVPRNHGKPTSMIAAISPKGLGVVGTVEGAVDGAVFTTYVRELLCPSLRVGQIVVVDNLNVHKAAVVRELIEAARCSLIFLPSYSPDFSPIELAFSKIKEALREAGGRTQEALDEAITKAVGMVTAADAKGWFHHCGYLV